MRRKLPLLAAAAVAAAGFLAWLAVYHPWLEERGVKVGVLHSLTGTMALSERPVVDATLLAIEEINAAGGVLGRRIIPVVADGGSDPATFATEAARLIDMEKVVTIFGCWTSACRKTVRPVIERANNLLMYPVQYEGLETSPNIFYLGAAPNQQILPAIRWSMQTLKARRFFLVGSDYVFPRTANAIISDHVTSLRGEVVGEAYIPLGSNDAAPVVKAIRQTQPDLIVNTINGDSNVAFFAALRAAGISPDKIPTMSFSLGESELDSMGAAAMAGDYAAWNYFQSIPSATNERFVAAFHRRYGAGRPIDDPMEAAYVAVHLWAQAVTDARQTDPVAIRNALLGQSLQAPEGLVYVDETTQHLWKPVRIGRIRPDGQFDIVWDSHAPVQPNPFPSFRLRRDWQEFLDQMYDGWGGWARPDGLSAPLILKPSPQ